MPFGKFRNKAPVQAMLADNPPSIGDPKLLPTYCALSQPGSPALLCHRRRRRRRSRGGIRHHHGAERRISAPVPKLPTFNPRMLLQVEPAPVTVAVPCEPVSLALSSRRTMG